MTDWYPDSPLWQDVDPARHSFAPHWASDTVRTAVSTPDPLSGRPRGLWSDNSVAQGLADRLGQDESDRTKKA